MESLDRSLWDQLRAMADRVMRFSGSAVQRDDVYALVSLDAVVWETSAWDSVRSDSHQIAYRVGGDAVWLQGSPARVCGDGDTVFGSGPAAALDVAECLRRMIRFVSDQIGVALPQEVTYWQVSRIDVTQNLLLDDLAAVRLALRVLRDCEGGRYRVSQQAGDTVYWSHRSRLLSGKAYAKGPHIEYQLKRPGYTGRGYSLHEMLLVNRLLRLELKIGAQYLRERAGKKWHELTAQELRQMWIEYFFRMVGSAEVSTESDLKQAIKRVVIDGKPISEGRFRAAYGCFLLIKAEGWEKARESFARSTWYSHLKVLHLAGLGDADIAAGTIVSFRRKVIESEMVSSWSDLFKAA